MERNKSSNLGKRPREEERDYRFKVLLPNGTSVNLILKGTDEGGISVEEFINKVIKEYDRIVGLKFVKGRRKILWRDPSTCLKDLDGIMLTGYIPFNCFPPKKCHILKLHDGVKEKEYADTFENMWDLTPDTDMLMELPQEYTFETALADLIDNSLQAVWSNARDERKLVSVTVDEDGISILDTGPGMDNSDKNSIVKWGKMGASLHRSVRRQAIGGNPPYLTPYFGMFGYGGAIASMHLGGHAKVSSKTKDSRIVYTLNLEREALLNSGEKAWKTPGGFRDPMDDEIRLSPHGSFTKVEISQLKAKPLDTSELKCRLKDIYFPYIQVNGDDLADLDIGEVAITNWFSCHGPDFVLQLRFLSNQDAVLVSTPGSKALQEAHARLKCVYYPIIEGKERINMILEKLKEEGFKVAETFDTFPRTSIRRLGRLLPDARLGRLPFMEPRQRKGDRAQVFKRCSMRVKCFIDTDAGFNPTPYKTDLAHHHPCTEALKNFGNKHFEKEMDVRVEIVRNEKSLSLSQLEKEYEEWLFQMHDKYDEEIVCGEDDPVVLFLSPHKQKELGVSSDVVRVHEVIERKGKTWKAGQQIKISKGAAGCHKNNICATLEYILLEGLEGDACGEARLICRPLHVPEEKGSLLRIDDVNASLDIRSSKSFPISVIDLGKCNIMEAAELEKQLDRLHQKAPSTIDILSIQDYQQLEIDEALTFDAPVYAGHVTLKKIIAVVRPVSYTSPSSFRSLDQKFIIKDDLGMSMEVTYIGQDGRLRDGEFKFGQRVNSSQHGGIQGLYVFSVGSTDLKHFQKSGVYKFVFTITCEDSSSKKCEKSLTVLPDTEVYQWKLLSDEKCPTLHTRVGSSLPRVSLACLDRYGNRMSFLPTPEVVVKIESLESVIDPVRRMKVEVSSDKMILNISDIWIESRKLDIIRPHFEASLVICSQDKLDKLCYVRVPCRVLPGVYCQVRLVSLQVEEHLLPGAVIKELVLELKDRYGNHVERGVSVCINVDGLGFEDQKGLTRQVDDNGYINLSGILKVKAGYGKIVSLSVNNGEETYFKKEFLVEKRMLKIGSTIPPCCPAGSQLEDLIFEVVDSDGTVDQTIHDTKFGKHTLKLTSEQLQDSLQYKFSNGRCTVPSILIPEEEGICFFVASHSCYPELSTNFQIRVMQPLEMQRGSLYVHEAVEPSLHTDRGMLLLQDSSACLSVDERALVGSFASGSQELHTEISRSGMKIMEHEKKLKLLCEKKATIEQGIHNLQALIEPQEFSQLGYFKNRKEAVERRIEGKGTKAASVICNMMKVAHSQGLLDPWFEGIIGVVALLGTVSNNNLSRIFAEHLGEKNMLAVVCKSYETASTLEKYEEHGKVDLYAIAAELGKSINGRFHVICLEEISPYTGVIDGNDPQRKLALPDPRLPTESIPPGYLGYAVNMINLDAPYMYTRTSKGHGLRETLFYRLFGELQVYETREYMMKACSYIKHGAVSLDGGNIKGNGILSLGAGEPKVCFPVSVSEGQLQLSPQSVDILREIAVQDLELEATSDEIKEGWKAYSEDFVEFQQKKDNYNSFLNTNKPVLNQLCHAYSQNVKTESRELD